MQTLFKIADTDYTEHVNKKAYSINETDIVEVWTDANYKVHGDLLRTKIQGTLTMTFTKVTEYNAFVSDLYANKGADGKVPVTVYVGKRNETREFNAFLDATNVKTLFSNSAYGGDAVVFMVTLKLEEE